MTTTPIELNRVYARGRTIVVREWTSPELVEREVADRRYREWHSVAAVRGESSRDRSLRTYAMSDRRRFGVRSRSRVGRPRWTRESIRSQTTD